MDAPKYIDRRLHPVRVAMGLLNHEIELSGSEGVVSLDKDLLRSVVETTLLFIEDFDRSIGKQKEKPANPYANSAASTKIG